MAPRIGRPEAKADGREALRGRRPMATESDYEEQKSRRAHGASQPVLAGREGMDRGEQQGLVPRAAHVAAAPWPDRSKKLSGRQDPSSVYLGLWARHFDSGVVEITNEMEMAYEAGYTGGRALRTWQERMALLQKHGFIRCQEAANQKHRYVLMLEPSEVIKALAKKGLIDDDWHATYDARRIATKEAAPAKAEKKTSKVVPMPGVAEKAK